MVTALRFGGGLPPTHHATAWPATVPVLAAAVAAIGPQTGGGDHTERTTVNTRRAAGLVAAQRSSQRSAGGAPTFGSLAALGGSGRGASERGIKQAAAEQQAAAASMSADSAARDRAPGRERVRSVVYNIGSACEVRYCECQLNSRQTSLPA